MPELTVVIPEEIIRAKIAANNYLPEGAESHMTTQEFHALYGLDALRKLTKDVNMLLFLFGSKDQNNQSLTYSLERSPRLVKYYAPAEAGNAQNIIVNYSKGSWNKQRTPITEAEAIEHAWSIRNSLIAVLERIDDKTTASEIRALLESEGLPVQSWLKKYLSILFPDRFMPMSIDKWINRIFVPLGLQPAENWFENAKIFSEKAATFGLDGFAMYHVVRACAIDHISTQLAERGISTDGLASIDNLLVTTKSDYESIRKYIDDNAASAFEAYLAEKYGWDSGSTASTAATFTSVTTDDEALIYKNKYTEKLIQAKNIIFRGAPGTGKSYLAKTIAADIVSNGTKNKYNDLSEEEKNQVAFVQFHPSYDYSDFVEGLRPVVENGQMGFELRPGIFKSFVEKARKNFENSKKSQAEFEKEQTLDEQLNEFLDECQESATKLQTVRGNEFIIVGYDEKYVSIHIPGNEIRKLLMSEQQFNTVKDVRLFFGKNHNTQQHSYEHIIYKGVKETVSKATIAPIQKEPLKKYVFIIDEINRGEISKILGELFFAIDPGYRGEEGAVFTQYSNLHDADEKFYIPENVYIIGTMNDIDRSVDTFDFAMRRRFRFVEIDANSHVDMLDQLGDKKEEAVRRMSALNTAIEEKLNKNYQIGGAYFLKLKTMSFEELWSDQLEPLLQEYVNGAYDEADQMECFRRAYTLKSETGDADNEGA